MSSGLPTMTAEDAATFIRTAFGKEPWRKKVRGTMQTKTLINALMTAEMYVKHNNLGEIIKWAYEMRKADDLYRDRPWT